MKKRLLVTEKAEDTTLIPEKAARLLMDYLQGGDVENSVDDALRFDADRLADLGLLGQYEYFQARGVKKFKLQITEGNY